MTTVRLVTHDDGVAAGCKDMDLARWPKEQALSASGRRFSGRCFQSVQRSLLLEMLDARGAQPDDLAFVADVDEIASPHVVALLVTARGGSSPCLASHASSCACASCACLLRMRA